MPILDIKSTQEAIKNPTLAMVIEEGFKITDANNELISNAYDTVENDATQSANSAKVAEQKANEANAHALASAESARQAKESADNAITIATDAESVANGIDAKATEALTNSEQAQAGVIRLDGKTDATNKRVGDLEISEGQQETLIGKNVNDIQYIKTNYLRKNSIHDTEEVTGRVDFKINPLTEDIKPSEVESFEGRRMLNYSTMRRDAVMLDGEQSIAGTKEYLGDNILSGRPYGLMNGKDIMTICANQIGIQQFAYRENAPFPFGITGIGRGGYRGSTFSNTKLECEIFSIQDFAFAESNITEIVNTSHFSYVSNSSFMGCASLKKADFTNLDFIWSNAFINCSSLTALILRKNGVVSLNNPNALEGTPIKNGTGYVYVPDALVEQYKTATNWIVYANQIKPISELPTEEVTV